MYLCWSPTDAFSRVHRCNTLSLRVSVSGAVRHPLPVCEGNATWKCDWSHLLLLLSFSEPRRKRRHNVTSKWRQCQSNPTLQRREKMTESWMRWKNFWRRFPVGAGTGRLMADGSRGKFKRMTWLKSFSSCLLCNFEGIVYRLSFVASTCLHFFE